MNILVATVSRHGSTREIGEVIAATLRAQGHTVRHCAVTEVHDLTTFDAAVIGSAVYMGNWLTEAYAFVRRNRADLSRMPVWLFSSGPVGPGTPTVATEHIETDVNLPLARGHRVFGGKLDVGKLGLSERILVRMVKAREGDYRDWEDIRDWSGEIASFPARWQSSSTTSQLSSPGI